MSKIELPTITSGYNLSAINNNFQKIEDTLNNEVLYRKGYLGEPNEMQTNLDMNGNKILNVVTGTSPSDLATRGYVDEEIAEERVYVDQQLDLVNSELGTKYDKTGGPVFGDINLNGHKLIGASEVQTSKTSTSILEINGVPVIPGNSVIDPYNGTREALRRSYAEAGYNLVDGSFEAGGTLVNANDVLLYEANGEAYSYLGIIPSGGYDVAPTTNPVGDADWKPVTDQLLRDELAAPGGVGLVGGAASSTDLAATNGNVAALNALVESRNYAKYTKAAELAKQLSDGGSFIVDCHGDSTMWGATPGNLSVQNPFNPPSVFKTTIKNLYGVTLVVNNLAISGTTMEQMLDGTDGSGSTFASKVASTAATLIYCNHCINDSQLDNDIHQYRLNVIEFVRLCRLYSKVPVLVTPNTNPAVTTDTIITEQKSKRLRNYVNVMRQVSHDLDVDLVDNFYYYEQTSRMVSPVTLVPDGAHPSAEGYKMSGRNMAIPLVSAHTLRKAWDKAGLANSTYFDNITSSRQYQTSGTPFNRFDGNLSGVRSAALTGINLAIILDNPTDDTVLAAYGLQWGSGTISSLHENGITSESEFGGDMNQYNNVSSIDWDACYIPERCKLYAGLHVVGILTSTAIDFASGDGFSLSGFGLVPRTDNGSGMSAANEIRNYSVVCTNSELSFDLALFASGTQFTLKGCSNDSTVINIDWAGPGGALTLTTSLGGSFVIASGVDAAVYHSRLVFNSDKSISVYVGSVSITVAAGPSPWPNMYVSTPGQSYNVRYKG